jgi:thymidylate kinase
MTKNIHIMIEGVDGVGKTSVCNLLSEKLDIRVVRMNAHKYFYSTIEEASRMFNDLLCQFEKFSFIMDRGYVSSIVYSKVYERNSDLSYLDEVNNILRPEVIILTATPEKLFERSPSDKVVDNDKRIPIQEEYIRFGRSHDLKIIDTTNLTIEEVCQEILKNL